MTSGLILAHSSAEHAPPQNRALNSLPCLAPRGSNCGLFFFFYLFKSLLGSSTGSHLHRLACGAATFTLPRTPKTPRGCHVPLSLRGEMISIGLLLMRLAGSLAGERWFQVCMSESLPACRCAARHNASASVQKLLSTNPGEGGSGTL